VCHCFAEAVQGATGTACAKQWHTVMRSVGWVWPSRSRLEAMTKKRKWVVALLAAFLVAAGLVHAPVLRGLAGLLIVDQPGDDFDWICLAAWGYGGDGDRCYDVAADLQREKSGSRILLIGPAMNRLEQTGVLSSFEAMSRRELQARGVSQEAISEERGGCRSDWENAHTLAAWLGKHPGSRVLLPCDQFRSAVVRHTLDAVLNPADAARVRVRALPNRNCDDTNWWKLRCGYRAFASAWLLRMQSWLGSGEAAAPSEKSADEYERAFLEHQPVKSP
jgi:hypothetical protein